MSAAGSGVAASCTILPSSLNSPPSGIKILESKGRQCAGALWVMHPAALGCGCGLLMGIMELRAPPGLTPLPKDEDKCLILKVSNASYKM